MDFTKLLEELKPLRTLLVLLAIFSIASADNHPAVCKVDMPTGNPGEMSSGSGTLVMVDDEYALVLTAQTCSRRRCSTGAE